MLMVVGVSDCRCVSGGMCVSGGLVLMVCGACGGLCANSGRCVTFVLVVVCVLVVVNVFVCVNRLSIKPKCIHAYTCMLQTLTTTKEPCTCPMTRTQKESVLLVRA